MSTAPTPEQIAAINRFIRSGLRSLERPEPLRLSEWAAEHFYLSAESSYVEGRWEAYPFQVAIMDVLSNDDIREVVFIKSARVGYTKMILAAMGYYAEHKKRNQSVWQPVDDDADEFVKTELEPMLRDVPAVRAVFPWYKSKSKYNTLKQKVFQGSTLHIRGGKAAKNYRRLSVDVAYLDELDGFDSDIEKEGDPVTLAAKRIEGATFPKLVLGSTPKLRGASLIEYRAEQAGGIYRYHVHCPHCDHSQPLRWGGKDVPHGIKWATGQPETAAYLCESCAALFTQGEYLDVWHLGRWQNDVGEWIDTSGLFRDAKGRMIDAPLRVAFHLWTAYSPMTSWAQIVREFLDACKDRSKLKTFVNTTLGETWEEDESEQADEMQLFSRREPWSADVPEGVAILTAGVDTQDDRFEIQIDGWGAGEERWTLDYVRLYGDPARQEIWAKLADILRRSHHRADGVLLNVRLACMDFGGHYGDEVTALSRKLGTRFMIPVKGSSTYGKPVALFPRKRNHKGVYLTEVGTDTAKDLLFQRLAIFTPGPGYWHWPIRECFDETYFKQLTAEERIKKWVQGQPRYVWDAKGRRQEPWDCSVYSLAAVRILQQHMGVNLELLARPVQTNKPTTEPVEPTRGKFVKRPSNSFFRR